MGSAIEVRDLTKSYGDHLAVEGLNLDVEVGEIVAFLGPNGAGKTTTIEILEGFRSATSGSVQVLGQDPADAPLSWREEIGIVLQNSEPIPELSALESLQMQADYYANPLDPDEVLERVGLTSSADHRVRNLSGGQLRRLDLAMAMVGNPSLLFLDEPTTGFDPSARRDSWSMIQDLKDRGNTVLLTTHYMDEAEHLADRIVVVADGQNVAEGTAAELAAAANLPTVISWRTDGNIVELPASLQQAVVTPKTTRPETTRIETTRIETTDAVQDLNTFTTWALANGHEILDLAVTRPNLEDVYLKLTELQADDHSAPPDTAQPQHGSREAGTEATS